MKWTIVIMLAVMVVGCSSRHMDVAMESWRGVHVNEVIKTWGYPAHDLEVANHHLYYWTSNNCERILDIDAEGIVRSWEQAGGGCPVFRADVQRYARPQSQARQALATSRPGPAQGYSPVARARRQARR